MTYPKTQQKDCTMNLMQESGANAVLMLSLVSNSSKKGWLGITKLQKLSFLGEYRLAQKGIRAFGYEFFMYDHGPISKGVYDEYESLLDEQLLIEDENGIQVSSTGNNISQQFEEVIPEEVKTIMQEVVSTYAHLRTHELRKLVHDMQIQLPNGVNMKVDNIGKGCTVLAPSSKHAFVLKRDYAETFAIMANNSLMKSIRSTRKKGSTFTPYKPLSSS